MVESLLLVYKKSTCNSLLYSVDLSISCLRVNIASVQLLFFLKPICDSFNCGSMIGRSLFSSILQNILPVWLSIPWYFVQSLLLPFLFHMRIIIALLHSSGVSCSVHTLLKVYVAISHLFLQLFRLVLRLYCPSLQLCWMVPYISSTFINPLAAIVDNRPLKCN
jgi:hypothetical protein